MDEELEMDYMEIRRQRRKRISSCMKSAATFLFSHLGLAAMVIGYSIMGGFLFMTLEAPNESKEKLRIKSFKEGKITEIRQLADLLCIRSITADNFTDLVNVIQLQFQQQVTLAVKNNGWDGKDETDETTIQWSFAGSLLYAVTVITTIGYGHVAPKTTAGRLVTIIYALVGIPLTFLYLSNMGNFMAECFRLFYKKICCSICIYCMNSDLKIAEEEAKDIAIQRNFGYLDVEEEYKKEASSYNRNAHVISPKSQQEIPSEERNKEGCDQEADAKRCSSIRSAMRRHMLREYTHGDADEEDAENVIMTNVDDVSGDKEDSDAGENQTSRFESPANQDDAHEVAFERINTGSDNQEIQRKHKEGSKVGSFSMTKKAKRPVDRSSSRRSERHRRPSGKRMVERRLSLESGTDMGKSDIRPLMIDKSVNTSTFFSLPEVRETDLAIANSSSFSLYRDAIASTPTGIHLKDLRSTPKSSSCKEEQFSTLSHSSASTTDPFIDSYTPKTSFSECQNWIPLKRLSSRSRTLGPEKPDDDSPTAFQMQNGEAATASKCATEGRARSESDDRQRVMYGRMMARQSMQARDDNALDDSQITVPISICLIIIGVYIFVGSMLFTVWEDWDYLTGSYFCFVTLSTIGFGDIVPGTDMKEWAAHQKLILCSLWLVVGLSLLAMCFNLMQEEVKDWCKWIGHRIGILKNE